MKITDEDQNVEHHNFTLMFVSLVSVVFKISMNLYKKLQQGYFYFRVNL